MRLDGRGAVGGQVGGVEEDLLEREGKWEGREGRGERGEGREGKGERGEEREGRR